MNQSSQPDEIDIIQFFAAIGRLFKNLYDGILTFFKSIFYLLIEGVIYFKKHYIILSLGLLIGLGLSFLGKKSNQIYYGQATLRTNYNAQLVLQEKVALINGLIQKNDSAKLAEILGVTPTQARHFIAFDLKPVFNDVLLIDDYSEYLKFKDTVVYKFIEYKDFKKNIKENPALNRYWRLKILADSPMAFYKLNQKIKNLFNQDATIEKRKQNYMAVLDLRKQQSLKNLQDIDSMRSIFNKVWLETAKMPNVTSTNIVVANQKMNGPETPYNLFAERARTINILESNSKNINKYNDAVILLNSFPQNGIKENSILNNRHFKYALLGLILAFLFLFARDFNTYLNKYQKLKMENKN